MSNLRVHLVANKKSGRGLGVTLPEVGSRLCQEFGAELIDYDVPRAEDFERKAKEAVDAAEKDGGIVVAAGGDGTIRGVAQQALGRNVRFGVVPIGTFNFFARNHLIPEDPEQAFRVILSGTSKKIRLGQINQQVFMINASLGLYAKAINDRKNHTSRFGRHRIVAILSTAYTLLRKHKLLDLRMVCEAHTETLKTPMIFIGNNALQLRDLKMSVAQCMSQDRLAVVVMKPLARSAIFRVLFRGLIKTIEKEQRLETFCVDSLSIHSKKHSYQVALDGEMFRMQTPLEICALPQALNMMVPAEGHEPS